MHVQNQPYSTMKHALLSAYGSRWKERFIAVYTLFIDDSGTSPNQPIAIAAGVVIPAVRLEAFEREWNKFLDKEGIQQDGFHTSECHTSHRKHPFADWSDDRVAKVFKRIRQIFRKYVCKAFCIATHKQDYDDLIPSEMRRGISSSHYVWGLASVLGLSYDWSVARSAPMEYVFDSDTNKEIKRDIEEGIDYSAEPHMRYGNHFKGHHSFRLRKDVCGLQLADFFAWHCYQAALQSVTKKPLSPLAAETWDSWSGQLSDKTEGNKIVIQRLTREGLADWVNNFHDSPADLSVRQYRLEQKAKRNQQQKKLPK